MNKNSQGYKIAYMYKLFEAYFNFKLSDSSHILNIIAPDNRPEARDMLKQIFGKEFTKLEKYTRALRDFIEYWIRGIPKDKQPWDWFLEFAQCPHIYLFEILKYAPTSEKKFIKARLKAAFNQPDSLQSTRMEFEARLNDPEFGEDFGIEPDEIVYLD